MPRLIFSRRGIRCGWPRRKQPRRETKRPKPMRMVIWLFCCISMNPRTPLWRKGWREKPLKTATTGATPGGCWRIWRKNGRLPKRPHRRNGSAGRSWRGKNRSAGSGWHGKNGNAGKRQNVQSGKSEKRRLRSAGRSLQSSVCW